MIDSIYQPRQLSGVLLRTNVKILCELIQDGLLSSWKFVFVFDPRLYDLQAPVLEFYILVLYAELIPSSLLN